MAKNEKMDGCRESSSLLLRLYINGTIVVRGSSSYVLRVWRQLYKILQTSPARFKKEPWIS
jgi:predicted transcriptional regulator